jgi:hypothetical protein
MKAAEYHGPTYYRVVDRKGVRTSVMTSTSSAQRRRPTPCQHALKITRKRRRKEEKSVKNTHVCVKASEHQRRLLVGVRAQRCVAILVWPTFFLAPLFAQEMMYRKAWGFGSEKHLWVHMHDMEDKTKLSMWPLKGTLACIYHRRISRIPGC